MLEKSALPIIFVATASTLCRWRGATVSQAWLWAAAWRERLGEKIGLKSKVENIGTGGPKSAKSGPKPRLPVPPEMP